MSSTSNLVSTDWLEEHLADVDIKVVDGSWYLPQMNRDALAEYRAARIPGAVHFPIDEIADTSSGLPHMLASADMFAKAVGGMGISRTDKVVVYDGAGLFSAPRVWWNFKVMGVEETFILDGGLPKWKAENRALEAGSATPMPVEFAPQIRTGATVDAKQVLAAGSSGAAQIVDLRPTPRFLGAAAEPRPGLRSGRIPNSLNLPFADLVTDGRLKPADELRQIIAGAGIDTTRPIISSCGSGVTAAFLNLALAEIGVDAIQLYDGSWAEWGADEKLPVATGPA